MNGWIRGRQLNVKYKREKEITCSICGYQCCGSYMVVHIREKHNLTKQKYMSLFPNSILYTEDFINKCRVNASKEMYKRWKNEQYKNKMMKILKDNATNPEYIEKRVQACKTGSRDYITPEYCKQISQRMQLEWKNEQQREKRLSSLRNSPKRFKTYETKQLISNKISDLWEQGVYTGCDKSYSWGKNYTYINKRNKEYNLKSLQELRVAYFLDLCNEEWFYGYRELKTFNYTDKLGKKHRYLPDFKCLSLYIEVKPNRVANVSRG